MQWKSLWVVCQMHKGNYTNTEVSNIEVKVNLLLFSLHDRKWNKPKRLETAMQDI